MAELLTQTIAPSWQGVNTDAGAHAMPANRAPEHANFLLNRPGIMPMRGPIVNHAELAMGTGYDRISGAWAFNDKLLIGFYNNDATAKRDPWRLPYKRSTTAGDVAVGKTTLKLVDLDAETVTSITTLDTAHVPGGRCTRLFSTAGDIVYGFEAYHASNVAQNGTNWPARRLMGWNGGTDANSGSGYAGTTGGSDIFAIDNSRAPYAGQDIIAHLNRLWVLGGSAPGAVYIEPNTLFFSDQGGPIPGTFDAAQWKDDATGLINRIVVDSDNPADIGVALAHVGEDLVIFKRHSIHVLSGYSPSTFTLRPFTREIGCLDKDSVVEYADGVYFLSQNGYMYFDGEQLIPVSQGLDTSLGRAMNGSVGPDTVDGGRACASKLDRDYILYSNYVQTPSSGAISNTADSFSAMLHTPSGAWSTFSSGVTHERIPLFSGSTMNYTWMFDGDQIVKTDHLTQPEEVAEASRGYDSLTISSVQQKARIPARWASPLIPLSTPPQMSQLHRLLVDYCFKVDGGTDGGTNGWFVTLYDATGTTLLAEYQLPSMGDPSSYLFRRRDVRDVFTESSDCQVVIEWRDSGGTYPALVKAELYNTTVEFSRSRQRRST